MNCVDINAKVRKDISEAMETVMKTVEGMDGDARITLLNSAKMTAGVAYLEDISSSLAVIADDIHYFREKDEAKSLDKFFEHKESEE